MKTITCFIFLSICLWACKTSQYTTLPQSASSTKGLVSSGQPLATLAGKEMLDKGGNAVDAAVASAFALSVVEPSMSGLGGRLQAIVRLPDGQTLGIDATTVAPMQYDTATTPPVKYGYAVIGIPGVVAGLCQLQSDHGQLPLKTVIQPAIRYAKKGFSLLAGEARRHASALKELQEFSGSRQYFLKENGKPIKAGEKWQQKDLAKVLEAIAESGPDAFYKGDIAQKIVSDFQANGGILTLEDLANYKVKTSKILSGSYRGYDLHALWMPSFGAITIEILHILENLPMHEIKGADWAVAVSQAIELAYEDRQKQYVENTDSIIHVLTSKAYAKTLASQIDLNASSTRTGFQEERAPESWASAGAIPRTFSTADENGMMVALTQSLGPNMGSKVATPGLGFLYAVTLGTYLGVYEPGQRASSHISPFLITEKGKPFMVLGAAGGSRIISAISAVSSRVIDHNMSLPDALAAPRVHPDSSKILLETHPGMGWTSDIVNNLKARGLEVDTVAQTGRFGRVHAILYDKEKKVWIGGADPDWEGAVGVEDDNGQ